MRARHFNQPELFGEEAKRCKGSSFTPLIKTSIKFLTLVAIVILLGCTTANKENLHLPESRVIWDAGRAREIPIALYFPKHRLKCTHSNPCSVAFISPGYGVPHIDYAFIANALVTSGYLVVAIGHDLPSDPPLSTSGDLFSSRLPVWQRGAENLQFVRNTLSQKYTGFDWLHLVLIGHSNGGDLSALALNQSPALATTLVTLDNRRYPLPRHTSLKVLSIRASDFEADEGVLPTEREINSAVCVTKIAGAHHNAMNDHGPAHLQAEIKQLILGFLINGLCVP